MLVLKYELKKNGKVFTSKFVGTGPSSYEKRIYRAAVSQILRNTAVHVSDFCTSIIMRNNCIYTTLGILIFCIASCLVCTILERSGTCKGYKYN